MARVIVLGSINRDIVVTVARIPRPGETVLGDDSREFPGGKGANQAVAASRMGADVTLIGATGNDGYARSMRAFLAEQGIDLTHVEACADVPTGIALISVDQAGENAITVSPGANARVGVAMIEGIAFQPGDILVCQFEIPLETVLAGFRKARAAGARTVLNPAPMREISGELLALTDLLVLNEHELAECSGSNLPGGEPILAEVMAKAIRGRGNPHLTVIATLGDEGCVAVGPEGRLRVPGERVTAVDTTGAGDCFVGALAAFLVKELALEEALRLANRAAAISVTKMGAAASMPTKIDLIEGFTGR